MTFLQVEIYTQIKGSRNRVAREINTIDVDLWIKTAVIGDGEHILARECEACILYG
jgi:hypothetical protein